MPYLETEYKTVEYHSRDWDCLVEQGWVTKEVSRDGQAAMIRQRKGELRLDKDVFGGEIVSGR